MADMTRRRLVALTGMAALFAVGPRTSDAQRDDIGYQIAVSDGETIEQTYGGLAAPGRSVTDRRPVRLRWDLDLRCPEPHRSEPATRCSGGRREFSRSA